MNTRPDMKKYKAPFSCILISIFAALDFGFGLFTLLGGSGESSVLGLSHTDVGLALIITSVFLFAMMNIVDDIHFQVYLKQYYGESQIIYQQESLRRLQAIYQAVSRPDAPPADSSAEAAEQPGE